MSASDRPDGRRGSPAGRSPDPAGSVILIGNGSSVLAHELGGRIDRFDTIIRLNNFRVTGHEAHVGTRTTIWARNIARDILPRDPATYARMWICAPTFAHSTAFWSKVKLRLTSIPIDRLKSAHPEGEVVPLEIASILERELALPDPRRHWPSTGMIALAYALTRASTVCLHGFDHFRPVEGHARHYFCGQEPVQRATPHIGLLEQRHTERLLRNGVVWRLI